MTAFPSYSTGTVSVANGDTEIVGADGANWNAVNAKPGDDIVIDGNTVVIIDVTDSTHLVIDAWPYTSVSAGATYKIIKRSPLRFAGGDAMADVSELIGALNTDGFFFFVDSDETEPDPSYGNDGQYAMQPSTGKVWLKDGGVWVSQGIYKGLGIAAPWDSGTAYQLNDVATLDGSSYICILAHTNHTPPNVTYWQLLASKGDKGDQGDTGAGYGGTSTTSLTIGTGSKVFTTQAGLAYTNGARVRASSAANASNWMEGTATYSGTTLTMTSSKSNGSGTHTDWNLNVVGDPGAGDLSSANNGSDFADKKTTLDNLSLHGADIASASTINLETATGNLIDVTGTTTITAVTLSEGHERTVRFTGALTLTNGASLVLPGGANITTAAGDFAVLRGYASGVVRCVLYSPVNRPPVMPALTTFLTSAVLLNNTANWFDVLTTGSIGASGQVWEISANIFAGGTAGAINVQGRIVDGSGTPVVFVTGEINTPAALFTNPMPMSVIVALTGPTTFKLQAKAPSATTGYVEAAGASGLGKLTSLTYKRLS